MRGWHLAVWGGWSLGVGGHMESRSVWGRWRPGALGVGKRSTGVSACGEDGVFVWRMESKICAGRWSLGVEGGHMVSASVCEADGVWECCRKGV